MYTLFVHEESRNGSFKFEVGPHQFNLKMQHFSQFHFDVKKKKLKKLAGLWLAGEVVNHVGLYGSKVAEGLSVFQHRSCKLWDEIIYPLLNFNGDNYFILIFARHVTTHPCRD